MDVPHMQIGEVAERTQLSLRTIRYYEEVGLVPPSARTTGGFRLYTETDVARLMLIRRMKPLDFTLEEMRAVLEVLDRLELTELPGEERAGLLDRLEMFREDADARVTGLRRQLETAEGFAADLRRELTRQKRMASRTR
ncbi:MerR family transcriptional regulator [Nocardioides mesophilus]|uniref:MerR family transcriptional regulator n=1 Tax=Nocardioides mesophilus TaxID=433659 RepID=A0A7G9RF73_9ACTN|nr:MerR family transcriptional regulator [Nocardioides mesophilus]QNN54248.1 MerR family transcriptional regulator [Nocardioides mesophilus]